MKIIEFNGDYWHANPRHYAAGDIVSKRLNTTAWDIWEKDRIKRETAIRAGFDVMVVWECDYRENPDVSHVARWISE